MARYTPTMRCVLQKVLRASVTVDGAPVGSIDRGYLLLVGIGAGDTDDAARWLAKKIVSLRLFPGEDGTHNDRTLLEVAGGVLVVSQFTLFGDVEGGNRPDYTAAAPRAEAERLYELFVDALRQEGVLQVATGRFGASMHVESINDGPVTLLLQR